MRQTLKKAIQLSFAFVHKKISKITFEKRVVLGIGVNEKMKLLCTTVYSYAINDVHRK